MIKDGAINHTAYGFALKAVVRNNIRATRCKTRNHKKNSRQKSTRDLRLIANDVGKNLVRSLSQAPVLTGQRKHPHDLQKESGPAFWAGPL